MPYLDVWNTEIPTGAPNPLTQTEVASLAGGSITTGHRYLVIATAFANPRGITQVHELEFGGSVNSSLTVRHRGKYGSPSDRFPVTMATIWTGTQWQAIRWLVTPENPDPSYTYDFRGGRLLIIDLDSALVENDDWLGAEDSTGKANLNNVYADNPGASITFTPDGTSSYMVFGCGSFDADSVNNVDDNIRWMELYDSIDGQLCEDGYGKADGVTHPHGSSHSALWVLDTPSDVSRTLTLRFRGDTGYATNDYKHSCLWIFRLEKSTSSVFGQDVKNASYSAFSYHVLQSQSITLDGGFFLSFHRPSIYSRVSGTNRMRPQLRIVGVTKHDPSICSSPAGTYAVGTSPPDPPMGFFAAQRNGFYAPGGTYNMQMVYYPYVTDANQKVFENCLVAFDLNMNDPVIPIYGSVETISGESTTVVEAVVKPPLTEPQVPDFPREVFEGGSISSSLALVFRNDPGVSDQLSISGLNNFTLVNPTITDLGYPASAARLGLLPGDRIFLIGGGQNDGKTYTLEDPNNMKTLEQIDFPDYNDYDFLAYRRK